MIFTLDVSNSYFSTHRLDENYKFVELELGKEYVLENVKTFKSYEEAKALKEKFPETIEINGDKVDANTNKYNIASSFVDIKFHRTEPPKQKYFTKDQLKSILYSHDDDRHNSLVIDYDGYIKIVPIKEITQPYPVRYETFQAGNGYVGNKWPERELEDLYESLLQGWACHLYTGNFIYTDFNDGTSSNDSIQEICELLSANFKNKI